MRLSGRQRQLGRGWIDVSQYSGQVKKTYSETERLQAQHRHAEKYAKKAARFRQEMALVDKGDDQTANNITLDIILAVACGALVLAALCAARRG